MPRVSSPVPRRSERADLISFLGMRSMNRSSVALALAKQYKSRSKEQPSWGNRATFSVSFSRCSMMSMISSCTSSLSSVAGGGAAANGASLGEAVDEGCVDGFVGGGG